MIAFRAVVGISLVLHVLALQACTQQALVRPTRTVSPSRDAGAVETALVRALQHRGWIAHKEQPGVIVATINVRTHQVVSRFTYSGTSIHADYVSSTNMGYEWQPDGRESIHRNYNGWVANVLRDVDVFLAQ